MPRKAGNSAKAERDTLREQMRGYGCTVGQIAADLRPWANTTTVRALDDRLASCGVVAKG